MEVIQPMPSCTPPSPTKASATSCTVSYVKCAAESTSSSQSRSALLARRSSKPNIFTSIMTLSSPSSTSGSPSSPSSSALSLLYTSRPPPYTPGETPTKSLTGPHASPSVSTSTATATGTLRTPRKGSGPGPELPFVPLTPIMASPRLTPDISATATVRGAETSWQGIAESETHPGGDAVATEFSDAGDYLTRGGQTAASSLTALSLDDGVQPTVSGTPTWTATPPTPPSRQASPAPSPVLSRSASRCRSSRAATVAALPLSRSSSSPSPSLPSSPSPAPSSAAVSAPIVRGRHHYLRSADVFADVAAPRRQMSLPPNLSRPLLATPSHARAGTASSSPVRPPSGLRERTLRPLSASMVISRGSVSKKGSVRKLFTLEGDTEGSEGEEDREGGPRRERKRRFRSKESGKSEESSPHLDMLGMKSSGDLEQKTESVREEARKVESATEIELDKLRAGTRKYHALMELLATEVGYLMDLRALVFVYLEQLPTLTTNFPPSSFTPTLSLPSLGLARNFPSSRSSFLHPSPSPSSTSSTSHIGLGDSGHSPPQEKGKIKEQSGEKGKERIKEKVKEGCIGGSFWTKDKSRDADVEKGAGNGDGEILGSTAPGGQGHDPQQQPQRKASKDELPTPPSLPSSPTKSKYTRRPILVEKDIHTVCRNADELLRVHDIFVRELRGAVSSLGLGKAFMLGEDGTLSRVPNIELVEPVVLDRIDEAVAAVAEIFINQAPSFSVYETFCPGHNEATDLIRHVQETHPAEWDTYEQQCSLLVAQAIDSDGVASSESCSVGHSTEDTIPLPSSATTTTAPSLPLTESVRTKRRHSTSSLAMLSSATYLDRKPRRPQLPDLVRSDPIDQERKLETSGSSSGHGCRSSQSQATRLKLLDYLIKPVQRICKYPLLLDQLKNKRARTQSAGAVTLRQSLQAGVGMGESRAEIGQDAVERASEAMRLVVSLVNRASEVQAHIVRSALIASRIAFTHSPSSSASSHGHGHSSSPSSRAQSLTPEFVASLGPCHLTGALDVVHHPSALHPPGSGALRAKYFGAFLYVGGYLVLVKIPRNGKTYEPRYWFSLLGFDMLDLDDDDSPLPFSFHLFGHGHHVQLAAACHAEKLIWMSAIQDALAVSPRWTNEPIPSLHIDEKRLDGVMVDEYPPEWTATPLPTIQSLSELEGQGDDQVNEVPLPSTSRMEYRSRPPSRLDSLSQRQEQQPQMATWVPLSRRSSTASVKAFFSPMLFDPSARIARPSSQVRQHVDHGLHDVFSELCTAARSQAQLREEELFQVRKSLGTGMTRSNSGLSITGAMTLAARRRYDSVLISRRKGSIDGSIEQPSDPEANARSLANFSGKAKSLASRCRKKTLPSMPLSVMSNLSKVDSEVQCESPLTLSPSTQLESPLAQSHCSSTASSNVGSALPSPIDHIVSLPLELAPDTTIRQGIVLPSGEDFRPKRARSMVDNVRYFFQSRPVSPSSSSNHSPTPPVTAPPEAEAEPQAAVQWWRRGSLRRRVQSSPDVPGEEAQPDDASNASENGHGTFLVHIPSKPLREQPLPPSSYHSPGDQRNAQSHSRRVEFNDTVPSRRRSLFAPSTRQRESSPRQETLEAPTAMSRKSLRNVWFFQRSSSFTPLDSK
ncbi:uncharacterized protein FIBRA_04422 [Fibroporia radiculosa]|uniref:DH domain-containing protein n=1 Tax=Fibroporia radiculosa TaxID=599839 RepID=J4GP81_9APHY|nr:uncharacterized protein FIBRA_04422 [Fibroporia radiculosa]CCM02330.1 predicted protein [Fibroporia radiculosa]